MRIVIQLCGGLLLLFVLLSSSTTITLHAAPLPQTGVNTTLTLNSIGNGTVTAVPTGPTYLYGEVVTLSATANPGATFTGWSGDLTTPDDWFAPLWDYRVPINIGANGYLRTERPVEVDIDFAALLNGLGIATAFDPNSLRVVEINNSAQIIDNNVPYQFDDTNGDGAGTLVFLLAGPTGVNQGRTYHVYFDVTGKGFSAPIFTDQVTLTEPTKKYQGQFSYQVETSNATYIYHKEGGGFATLDDVDNNDWISYKAGTSGAGGAFRGIPNMIYPESKFHPGKTGSTTTVVSSGPLKETISTVTADGKWEAIWEFFPTFARMTVLKKDHNYWFLYEGTPGGSLDVASDFIVRADGTQNLLSDSWQADLAGDEWVYVGDPTIGRSLFLAHHTNDSAVESYKPMDGLMTVFGFGRRNDPTPLASTISQVPDSFTIGLVDETTYTPMAQAIHGAYKALTIQSDALQQRGHHQATIPANSSTVTVAMTSNRALTANFAALEHTLTVQSTGEGTVDVTPQKPVYLHGEQVHLTASPAAGWTLDQWSGDLTGATSPVLITINADTAITANFVQIPYTINLAIVGGGTAAKSPDQATYVYNDLATLTATADPGWHFVEWQGARPKTQNPLEITITETRAITALFALNQYTVVTDLVGKGDLLLTPDQTTYTYGDVVTLLATPVDGWLFDGWQGDVISTTNPLQLTIADNINVTAHFSQQNYPLITLVEAGGTITTTPASASYLHGTTVELTALPEAGWRFVRWQGDANGTVNPLSITMDRAKAIEARFEQIPYTLVVNQVSGGTIAWSPVQESYFYGDEITFAATPDEGLFFAGWSGALSGDETPLVLTVRTDALVSAAFTAMPYRLTTGQSGEGTVTVTPEQTNYVPGSQVQIAAKPATGWTFIGWHGAITGTVTPLTITMNSDISVTAEFVEASIPITIIQATGQGNIAVSPDKATYAQGETITLTATPASGQRFVRWILTADGQITRVENPLTITVEQALTIRAEFSDQALPYAIFLPLVTRQ